MVVDGTVNVHLFQSTPGFSAGRNESLEIDWEAATRVSIHSRLFGREKHGVALFGSSVIWRFNPLPAFRPGETIALLAGE